MGWFMTRKNKLHQTIAADVFATPALAFCLAFSLVFGLTAQQPAAADATVYRCGPPGSQWYSQIPCAEDSEAVVIKDQHLLDDSGNAPAAAKPTDANETGEDSAPDTTSNAEAFITQLEKQRSEQLAVIDRDIARLQNQDTEPVEGEENTAEEAENAALLAGLQNTRESIVSEYDAMIQAAQQRLAKP